MFEKRRYRSFLLFVQNFNIDDPKTWSSIDPNKSTASELYQYFKLEKDTADFTGHALALYRNDEYVNYFASFQNTIMVD